MCRHAAYVGPDVRLDRFMLDPPHGLVSQSYAARELLQGSVAADGFGVAWYRDEAGETPAAYRSLLPIWADRSFESVMRHVFGHAVVANVRNATEAGTNQTGNVHPFVAGRFTFSHNGFVAGFRSRYMRRLRAELSEVHYAALEGTTESETLFRWVLTRIDEGATPRVALRDVVQALHDLTLGEGAVAQTNLILSDGATVWATRASNQDGSNSLYVAHEHPGFPGAALVASEPMDEGPWLEVPDQHLVVLHAGEPPDFQPLA